MLVFCPHCRVAAQSIRCSHTSFAQIFDLVAKLMQLNSKIFDFVNLTATQVCSASFSFARLALRTKSCAYIYIFRYISHWVDNYHQGSHLVRDLILILSVLFRNCSKSPALSFFVYIYENNLLIYCFSSIIFRLRLDYRFFSLFSFQGSNYVIKNIT